MTEECCSEQLHTTLIQINHTLFRNIDSFRLVINRLCSDDTGCFSEDSPYL